MTSDVIGALAGAAAVLALGLLPLAGAWVAPSIRHPDAAALADHIAAGGKREPAM